MSTISDKMVQAAIKGANEFFASGACPPIKIEGEHLEFPPPVAAEMFRAALSAALSVALPMQEPTPVSEGELFEAIRSIIYKRVSSQVDTHFIDRIHLVGVPDAAAEITALVYATPAASVAPAVKVKALSETLNFYISDAEDGVCRVPRQKLVEIQQQLRAVDALTSSTASGSQPRTLREDLLRIHQQILTSDLRFVHPAHPDTWSRWADTILDAAIAVDLSERRASTASGEDGWRDISSAPKDGTEIDLWARRDGTNRYERVPDCSWQFMSDWDGREFDGWMGLRRGFSRSYVEPTHWRLPPPAPSSSKEDGNAR